MQRLLELLKAYRIPLIGLALIIVPGLTVIFHDSSQTPTSVESTTRQGVTWFQVGTTGVLRTLTSPIDALLGRGADKSREELKREIAKLREEKTRLIGVLQENIRLRQLVGFQKKHPKFELAAGRVVGRDLSPFFRVMKIEIRTTRQVKKDMPVVAHGGVVGRVFRVYGRFADVILLSDPRSRVDALVQRNRALGVVRGLGHQRDYLAEVSYLSKRDEIREGDTMVTSGMDGIYPQELRVGTIQRVHDSDDEPLFQRAILKPAVDFARLEELFVITGTSSNG